MKKYAVVGGAGFIGHHLVNKLLNLGNEVVVIDDLSTGCRENVDPRAELVILDISVESSAGNLTEPIMTDIFGEVDSVFLTAARARVAPSMVDPLTYNRINVEGILRVLVSAKEAKVKRLVYSSSSNVYGHVNKLPINEESDTDILNPYGLQKYIGEQYCRLFSRIFDLDTVCLRYFNVYGHGMPTDGAYASVLAIFNEQFKKNVPLTITSDGNQRRDFTHVDDVVNANILAAMSETKWGGRPINVGNGVSRTINEIADLFKEDRILVSGRDGEIRNSEADNSLAKKLLGWQPTGDFEKFINEYKMG